MKRTFRAIIFFGLAVAIFQSAPAHAQSTTPSIFQVVPTPDQNTVNNQLFAAAASSPDDIWAVGHTVIHFDGNEWSTVPAPGIDGTLSNDLLGIVDISPTLAWAVGNLAQPGDQPQQVIEQWNGTEWNIFPGPTFPPNSQALLQAITAPDFIIHTGDLSQLSKPSEFDNSIGGCNFGYYGIDWALGPGESRRGSCGSKELNRQAYIRLLRADLKARREQIIKETMQLSDQQAAVFWPIYRNYNSEQTKLGDDKLAIVNDYAQDFMTMNDEKANHLAQKTMALEDQRSALRRKYYELMKKALPTVLVVRFFQVENQIQLLTDLQIASNLPIIEQTQ